MLVSKDTLVYGVYLDFGACLTLVSPFALKINTNDNNTEIIRHESSSILTQIDSKEVAVDM